MFFVYRGSAIRQLDFKVILTYFVLMLIRLTLWTILVESSEAVRLMFNIVDILMMQFYTFYIALGIYVLRSRYFDGCQAYYGIFIVGVILIVDVAVILLPVDDARPIIGFGLLIKLLFMHFKYIDVMKRKNIEKIVYKNLGFSIKAPIEKVIMILNTIRDRMNPLEIGFIDNINYCINIISENKLYEQGAIFSDEEKIDK
jgi:hypothetical protein